MAALQVGDLITTNLLLAHGGGELNPIMAWCQATLGSYWAVPKFAAGGFAIWLLSRSRKPQHVAPVVALPGQPF